MARCDVCFRCCEIPEGGKGFCGARACENGTVRAGNYGKITGFSLDPIEKKPLRRFYPGSMILRVQPALPLLPEPWDFLVGRSHGAGGQR